VTSAIFNGVERATIWVVPMQTESPPSQLSDSLTDQQRRAVATRHTSVVLSSGAGCGKTTVLTERYLSHLRDDAAEVGQVVAITFTDRAARQMRKRIREKVEKQLDDSKANDAAADIWTRHLRNLETAPISTIHAFCAALLRQNAVEAGLDPRFDVLEEVLSVNLEAEALNSCLQRLLTAQTEPGEDLRQLVLLYGWRPVVEAVRHLLRSRDETRWRSWLGAPAAQAADQWREYGRQELLPRHIAHLLSARPPVTRCLGLLRRSPAPLGVMADNVRRLLEELPRLAEAPDLAAAVTEFHELAKVGAIGKKAWPDPVVYEPIKAAFEKLRAELKSWNLACFEATAEALQEAVAVGRRLLRVAGEAVAVYRERKRAHGVVDFQDLLTSTRDLLRDHPAVCARLRQRYRFLLIDELQDTDPVQMELVDLLCGPGLTAGKLFAVGDANQSIYRFRGADVHLFQGLRKQMTDEGRQELTRNYRSQPAILQFANALFRCHLAPFDDLKAFRPQINRGACVEFLWSPRPEKDEGKAGIAEGRAVEAQWIAERIAALVRDEAKIVVEGKGDQSHLRPVTPGDVVLLFRAMSNVSLYEAALRNAGLDYYLVGGRAFFAQQEIYDLLNLLRMLENPQDGVSLAGVLRSPFCCVSDEALFVIGQGRDGLWAGLCDESFDARLPADQREPVARARRHLRRWRGLKDRLPIARLLGAVFADSGYDAATQFEFLGDRKLANLWKLQDLARTFDRSGLFGLAEFIARLGDLVGNQAREEQAATQIENADVVRMMTIHQAKGLEFPVVIVPDLAAIGHGGGRPIAQWDRRFGCVAKPPFEEDEPEFTDFGWQLWKAQADLEEWQEDLRTLYVACTRAEDYLILSSSLPDPYQPAGPWMQTLAERFDMETGRCLAADVEEKQRPVVQVYDRKSAFWRAGSRKRPEDTFDR
jgi:ATP-dependent helicase/nuclease subunit A